MVTRAEVQQARERLEELNEELRIATNEICAAHGTTVDQLQYISREKAAQIFGEISERTGEFYLVIGGMRWARHEIHLCMMGRSIDVERFPPDARGRCERILYEARHGGTDEDRRSKKRKKGSGKWVRW